jgi:hypothetical protein
LANLISLNLPVEILQIHEVSTVLKDNVTSAALSLSKAKFREQIAHVIEADIRVAPAAHHLFEDLVGLTHAVLSSVADVFRLGQEARLCLASARQGYGPQAQRFAKRLISLCKCS